MERFCNKCGKLVNGDGIFCPNCGEKLEGAVDLTKPSSSVSDVMPTVSTNSTNNTYSTNTTNSSSTYQGQMPNYSQPVYPMNTGMNQSAEMTTGQWALTIFLSGLGIIGIILLFVWAFGSDTQPNKRNYARGMLILYAISLGLCILMLIGTFACAGCAAGGMASWIEDMEDMGYYAAINNLFIR